MKTLILAKIKNLWLNNQLIIILIAIMLIFRSILADWNDVPTTSMKPTIIEGDRIFINKMAYDIRIPFTHISLLRLAEPKHNDIIIFDSKNSNKRLVKRVIGIPGDRVSMKNNVLTINSDTLSYIDKKHNDATIEQLEILVDYRRTIKINKKGSSLSNFSAINVPQDHYLVLGDNRDKSADSRLIGFIPRNEIVGKTNSVFFSLNPKKYFLPRTERFFYSFQQ